MSADKTLLSAENSSMATIRKKLVAFFKNHDVNMLITAVLGLVSTYVSVASILQKNIFHPLSNTIVYAIDHDPTTTTMAVVILWSVACAAGKVLNLFDLPFPFGAMLVGVVITNVPFGFFDRLVLNPEWDLMVRRIALGVLIIRWGLAFNFTFIGKNLKTVLLLGTVPAIAEAGAITLISAGVFGHYWGISVMLGAVMTAASVPVVIPVMFRLTRLGLGGEREIPKIIPASLAVDTFLCLTVFTLAGTSIFAEESAFDNILQLLIDVGLCSTGALVLGLILWHFPKSKEGHTVFARGYILLFTAVAAINGMFYFGHGYAGIVFVLVLASTASHKWRNENSKTIFSIDKIFIYIWNLVSSPLMFVLVGMKLKLHLLSWGLVGSVFFIVAVGIICRLTAGYLVTKDFRQKERIVILMSMIPKATLQGALAPTVITMTANFPHFEQDASFLVNAVLLNILFTAPIGRILLTTLAPKLLAQSEGKPQPRLPDTSVIEEDISITEAANNCQCRNETPTEVKVIALSSFDKLPSFYLNRK